MVCIRTSSPEDSRAEDQTLPRTCPPRVVFALSRPAPQREASRTQTPASRDQPPQLRSALVLAVKTSPPYPSERRRAPLWLRWWILSLKPKLLIIGRRRRRRKKTHSQEEDEEDALCEDSLFFLSSPARSLRHDSFSTWLTQV